ncbi:MAG TPA: GTPase activator [Micromonosporaceae bacterium]|nr:GTPase activator [Micromonosporaceae bacterium]
MSEPGPHAEQPTTAEDGPSGGADARSHEELQRTREAQDAHGGSMAPGLVDATGQPIAEDPPGAP